MTPCRRTQGLMRLLLATAAGLALFAPSALAQQVGPINLVATPMGG